MKTPEELIGTLVTIETELLEAYSSLTSTCIGGNKEEILKAARNYELKAAELKGAKRVFTALLTAFGYTTIEALELVDLAHRMATEK